MLPVRLHSAISTCRSGRRCAAVTLPSPHGCAAASAEQIGRGRGHRLIRGANSARNRQLFGIVRPYPQQTMVAGPYGFHALPRMKPSHDEDDWMPKKHKNTKRIPWSKSDDRALKAHSKRKTSVVKISKEMKRTTGALRQRAHALGISLGHRT
jgi:hypothetical protein